LSTKASGKYRPIVKRFCHHKAAVVCLVILVVLIGMAVLAPVIAPYEPTKPTGKFSQPPTPEHILGTDKIGGYVQPHPVRYAGEPAGGLLGHLISTVIGVILGLVSGYFGGRWIRPS
jgi:peptide/nickel transport system permease protein